MGKLLKLISGNKFFEVNFGFLFRFIDQNKNKNIFREPKMCHTQRLNKIGWLVLYDISEFNARISDDLTQEY